MGKKETSIQNSIIKYLKSKRIFCYRQQVAMNNIGMPDVIAIIDGYYVGLEIKTNIGKPSDIQKQKIKLINESGGIALIITNLQQVKNMEECINKSPRTLR